MSKTERSAQSGWIFDLISVVKITVISVAVRWIHYAHTRIIPYQSFSSSSNQKKDTQFHKHQMCTYYSGHVLESIPRLSYNVLEDCHCKSVVLCHQLLNGSMFD